MKKRKRPPLLKDTVKHSVDVYTLNQIGNLDIIKPERVYIKMVEGQSYEAKGFDLGILCYARREVPNPFGGENGYWVDPNSLKISRRVLVTGLLDKAFRSDWRQATVVARFRDIRNVVIWCDGNGHIDFLDSVENVAFAYRQCSDYLHGQVVTGVMSRRTGNIWQKAFSLIITLCFGVDEAVAASRGVVRLRSERPDVRAPEEKDVKTYVDVLLGLLDSLPRQLMSGAPFPFKINMRNYSTYYFHSYGNNIKTPYFEPKLGIYDFDEGRIATAEEHLEKIGPYMPTSIRAVQDAKNSLAACNADLNCEARKQVISMVLQAYASLFLLLTGANPSQFIGLEHDEAIEVAEGSAKKELTAVKFRARGKLVRFPVGGKQGIRILREYLEFRSWALGDNEIKVLFFYFTRKGRYTNDPVPLGPSFQSKFFTQRLRGRYLPENAINISSSLGRKYKSVVLHELKAKPETVAGVLGHTLDVNIKSYSQGNKRTQAKEFKAHWKAIRAAASRIKVIDNKTVSDESTVAGHCEEKNAPVAISSDAPIQPNCKTENGCLYCKQYTCHADEEDVHKLLSMRYVLIAVREQSDDADHADSLLKDMCIRISVILEAVEKTSKEALEMVLRMKEEVDEYGKLTPFWAARMERYEAMGVLI